MTKIISVMSSKGGTSKTTLSLNLFYYLKLKGFQVILADCDPQKSAYNFLKDREEENRAFIDNEKLLNNLLKQAKKRVDFVIIDSKPDINKLNKIILTTSDKVLLTTKVSRLDVKSLFYTLDLLDNKKKAKLLFVQVLNNSTKTKANIEKIKETFKNEEVNILDKTLSHSINYVTSINENQSIFESKFRKQKQELTDIFSAFLN